MPLGRKLASGRDADVFELADPALHGRVLRRRRGGRLSVREADVTRQARANGYPAPTVYDVRGADMLVERITGPTMLQDLGKKPWMVWRHARTLARLHRRLARIRPLDGMQPFPPAEFGGSVPDSGGVLLHLDLHPDNVILSPRGPVVIDWEAARRGEVDAAVALTWVIMATSEIPVGGLKGWIFSVLRWVLVWAFLHHAGRAGAVRHLPAVAQVRLRDRNVRPSERAAIRKLLARHGLPA
ncbi:MAG: phosphotransferase [Chloroflexi bacterium]|nr:phosphotransferase [Chloroflexota bacterium]